MTARQGVKNGVNFLLDLLFPITCQECGSEGSYLCLSCQEKMHEPEQKCFLCSKVSYLGKTHDDCRERNTSLTGLLVALDYHKNSIKNLIWNLKYNEIRDISEILSVMMADFLIKYDLEDYFAGSLVVPVPLHKKRLKKRGYNQAALVAEKFAKKLGYDYSPILERIINNPRQVDLKKEERIKNVENVFSATITPSLGERKIIIIDDVATTGATLNECAKVLKKQKCGEIWGLVAARN